MIKDTTLRIAVVATAIAVAGAANHALAQTPPPKLEVTSPANVLSLGEIESRLSTQGIKIREVEVRDVLLEVEGYDSQGRKIELVIDRRTGETLSQKLDK